MEVSQSFRAKGSVNIEKIPCDQVNGQYIIYWEDIKEVFPKIRYLKYGDTTVTKLREGGKRIEPLRIKHYPGAVLDVVLQTSLGNGSAKSPMQYPNPSTRNQTDDLTKIQTGPSTVDDIIQSLQVGYPPGDTPNNNDILRTSASQSQSLLPSDKTSSKVGLSFKQVVKLAQRKLIESEVEQRLVSSLPSDLQLQVRSSTNVHDALVRVITDGRMVQPNEELAARLQELKDMMAENTEMTSKIVNLVTKINELASENNGLTNRVIKLQETLDSKQDEMKRLQTQALDQLALLQNNVKGLLTQTYELHEYPIPRLFIVLPADSSSWNPMNILANKFRLYFLCECGEHTRSTNSKIPHHIHLAKHEGYDITRPKEFFHQYGSYILTILRMLKFGIAVAGVTVPTLSLLVQDDALQKASSSLKMLVGNIQSGMDQVIGCIEGVTEAEGVVDGCSEQMENNEALEGADLRQLETFLKDKDENRVLGNLYRTVTSEGHVKWVCLDHYRENYHEKAAKAFRDTMSTLDGTFDENIGRAEVTLDSRLKAEQFYGALEKAKSVYELKIGLKWGNSKSDFKRLRDTFAKTNVGVLELDLHSSDERSEIDVFIKRGPKFDPIFELMRHPSVRSVKIDGAPREFFMRCSLESRKCMFPNLRHLDIDLKVLTFNVPVLKHLVANTPNLSSLTFRNDNGYCDDVYTTVAEYQKYPITFTEQSLCIPPPEREPYQSLATHQYLAYYYKLRDKLVLGKSELEESAVATLAEETWDVSNFTSLTLLQGRGRLSDSMAKNIASIVARSAMDEIDLRTKTEPGCAYILEAIQWEYLRELLIEHESVEMRLMRALVDSTKKLPGRVELEKFRFTRSSRYDVPSLPQDGLLSAFLSLTSLKILILDVLMTPDQADFLLKSIDLSRMQKLHLWTKGCTSDKVDTILHLLQDATELQDIALWGATIIEEQKERMKAKGIALQD